MSAAEAKAAALNAGCTLIDEHITLTELNQLLLMPNTSCDELKQVQMFADFELGSKLGAVLAIGNANSLRLLHLKANKSYDVV